MLGTGIGLCVALTVHAESPTKKADEKMASTQLSQASFTTFLKKLHELNQASKYSEAQAEFDSKMGSWNLKNRSDEGQDQLDQSKISDQVFLKSFVEYTTSLLKLKKYNLCQQTFADLTSPYCCGSWMAESQDEMSVYKAIAKNDQLCRQGWTYKTVGLRKKITLQSCGSAGLNFKINSKTCLLFKNAFEPKAASAIESDEVETAALNNPNVIIYVNRKGEKDQKIKLAKDVSIPQNYGEALKLQFFEPDIEPDPALATPTPTPLMTPVSTTQPIVQISPTPVPHLPRTKVAVLISGATHNADGGTGRGHFQTFGIIDVEKMSFQKLDEIEINYH